MKSLKEINWNQVYYFYEVAKRLSMKKAALQLHVSLPTVSEQIKALETALDTQLFRREVRRIELTAEGERLFHCAREMFEAGYRFLDAVSTDAIGGYTARVGVQETILLVATSFLARYWDNFAPFGVVNSVREIFFERLVERVVKNELDWAIVLTAPSTPRVEYREIGTFEVAFCCSPFIREQFRREDDIVRYLPLARNSWDSVVNNAVDIQLRAAGAFPREIIESDHREYCLTLARCGRCVTTFTTETLKSASWSSDLTAFRIGEPILMKVYAVWNVANRKSIFVRKLVETLDVNPVKVQLDPGLQIRLSDVPTEVLISALDVT